MKKFKSFLLVAAALVMGLASCQSETNDPVNPEVNGPRAMAISFANIAEARLVGNEIVHNAPVAFNSGTLYLVTNLTDAGAVVQRFSITDAPTDIANGIINRGAVTANVNANSVIIPNIPGTVNAAILVGNTAAPTTPHTTVGAIRNQTLDVLSQSITAGSTATINLYAQAAIEPASAAQITATGHTGPNTLMVAELELAPTVARVELHNVRGTNWIADFQIAGIFMDNYYQTGTVGGLTPTLLRDRGGVGSHPTFTGPNFINTVAGAAIPGGSDPIGDTGFAIHDWNAGGLGVHTAWTGIATPATTIPAAPVGGVTQVWGYNLFARTAAMNVNVRVPRIYIRFHSVRMFPGMWSHPVGDPARAWVPNTAAPDTDWVLVEHTPAVMDTDGVTVIDPAIPVSATHPLFVTIQGFRDTPDGANRQTIRAGNVYKIGAANAWAFGPENLTPDPNLPLRDLLVLVTVANWQVVEVHPDLQ